MTSSPLRSLARSTGLCAFLIGGLASAQDAPKSAPPKPAQAAAGTIPAGAEKAVAAALAAYPGAKLAEVVTPSQAFGIGGGHDSFWTVHLDVGGARATVNAGSEGVVIHGSRPVETKDLPTMVATAMGRMAPKGAAKLTKRETFGVVRYVAMAKPQVRYTARVTGAAEAFDVAVAPDGTLLDRKAVPAAKAAPAAKESSEESEESSEEAPEKDAAVRKSDGPIPEPAARAVAAMREVFPDMVFDLVEEVPYLDSSTQTMTMLWYEVEFFVDGVKHEFNATPDGIVIAYRKKVAASQLPKAAAEAIAKAAAAGTIEQITLAETRAEPRIVAVDTPVVVYEIEPNVEAGAKKTRIKLRADGTEVKEPELPDWAKTPEEKEGR